MELKDLIHKLEKARTKDDLEALGIEHLGIDVDKRKTKEVVRAELLGEAEARLANEASDEPEPAREPAQASEPTPTETAPEAPRHDVKMARNKRTGRVMQWTAAMAKMSHMEQV